MERTGQPCGRYADTQGLRPPLIERSLANFSDDVHLAYPPTGVTFTLEAPIEALRQVRRGMFRCAPIPRPEQAAAASVTMAMRIACAWALLILLPAAALAAPPTPPCDGQAPVPAYAPASAPPATGVWSGADLRGVALASCLGWTGESRLIVALATTFHSPLTADQLLRKLAAVSAYPSVKYWSVTRQAWRPLAAQAAVLTAPDAITTRSDLSPEELSSGRQVYYSEHGDLSAATHRLRVVERSADHLVVTTENTTPIRLMVVTVFEPGALQLATFIDRAGPDLWTLYQITRVGAASSAMAADHAASYVNRLDAFRRYLSNVPTDREPPLMPH